MVCAKTQGTDGLTVELHATFQATLARKLLAVYQEAHQQRILLSSLREALIVVLPKQGRDPLEYSGYRSPHNNMLNNENRSTVGRTGTRVVKIIRRPAPWRLPHRRREAGNLNFFLSGEHSHVGAGSRDGKAESRWFGCRCSSYERGS
ncbi:hypothetical protein NDU88_002941 [Pleurodeles waltl]|uniref:Uncharacterized protein n=1 Tax=Pleurodeles waltl TaxID=8319 RepID=A0AAV7UEF8_PLEWA|nr:hypothetical protein NDU88_002941 [Pleurodeles waltl]